MREALQTLREPDATVASAKASALEEELCRFNERHQQEGEPARKVLKESERYRGEVEQQAKSERQKLRVRADQKAERHKQAIRK